MKLLNKTTLLYIVFTIPALLILSVVFYFMLHKVITNEADKMLLKEKNLIVSSFSKKNYNTSDLYKQISSSYQIVELSENLYIPDIYSFVNLFDSVDLVFKPYRELRSSAIIKSRNYEIILYKSFVELDYLIYVMIVIGVALFLILSLYFILINLSISRIIWRPFYMLLNKLRDFAPEHYKHTELPVTSTKEFKQLNQAFERLTQRVVDDFNNQKQFIHNVSHEIQTPLSIINTQLELLIQNEKLSAEDIKYLQVIAETTDRLAKLNSALLLLSRIENNQYHHHEKIDFIELIKSVVDKYDDQIEVKKIKLDVVYPLEFNVEMNGILADALISNLLSNAIRHNYLNGSIKIEFENAKIIVANTGEELDVPKDKIFEKFVKSNRTKESLGLGLTLVKQICQLYQIEIKYYAKSQWHVFELFFNVNKS
jgi:signal transduction histidine kinase